MSHMDCLSRFFSLNAQLKVHVVNNIKKVILFFFFYYFFQMYLQKEAHWNVCGSRPAWCLRPHCISLLFVHDDEQALPSNIMFVCILSDTQQSLRPVCLFVLLCLCGCLFCSSLRLNSQSSRDKMPAPRLAPRLSWNNLGRHVTQGGGGSLHTANTPQALWHLLIASTAKQTSFLPASKENNAQHLINIRPARLDNTFS